MSDEYGSEGTGFKGSLVNDSLDNRDATSNPSPNNYPSSNDSTSSGGYGTNEFGNAFSDKNQRGGQDGFEKGTFGTPPSASNPNTNTMGNAGGFQPISDRSETMDGQGTGAGTAERKFANTTEEGGAAREAGTLNDVGA